MGVGYLNHDLVKEIFDKAIDVPLEEREAFVAKCSGGDLEIIAEVHSLLQCTSDEDDNEEIFDPIIGEFAGPWKIEKRIGGGGMGRVYSATDPKTNKSAAIKVLRRVLIDCTAAKRFEQEIRVLGRIDHDGVARIKGAGTLELEGDRVPWIAMELIEGAVPITAYAQGRHLKERIRLMRDVCLAVGEAHKRGVIHRDIKPSNILVTTSGKVKIIDFGIAKVIDETIRPTGLRTETGGLLGTLQYMPPETPANVSGHAQTTGDVYSLGVVLYEMLAGHRPYELRGESISELVQAMSMTDPTPIDAAFPAYKGSVAAVVHKALARDPKKRYATANEFAGDLQHLVDDTPVSARPEPLFVRLIRKHRTATAVLAITIPILFVATAVSTYFAIDANTQLVRNEKMLLFAKDAMNVQREILHQHSDYWIMHSGNAKARADELTRDDILLRVEMYELLGGQSNTQRISPMIYEEAYKLVSDQLGENHPKALILEAKFVSAMGIRNELGEYDEEGSISRLESLLERWKGGTPQQHAEFLYQIARVKLASVHAEVREEGHQHAILSEEIARNFYVDGEDEKQVVQPIGRRAWSYIFKEGDVDSLTKAIALLNEKALPLLRAKYDSADIRVLKSMAYLAIAHLQRSFHEEGDGQLADIEEALKINEFVVHEIIKQSGDGYNTAWQVMNNLAMSLAAKARWLASKEVDLETVKYLKERAASLWLRILQQIHFKSPREKDVYKWYLSTFQDELPKYAPTDEEHAAWMKMVNRLPGNAL